MTVKEIELEGLRESYDWAEVFGEGDGGNTDQEIESIDGTPCDTCLRCNVVEIIAAVNGENDETDWSGVFRMNDGRFLAASGWCDYTGWDCQAGNKMTVASTLENVIKFGLTPAEATRLGLSHPGKEINE